MRFVVHKAAPGQVPPLPPPSRQSYSTAICMLFILEGQKREAREHSEEQRTFRNGGALDRKMLSIYNNINSQLDEQ